MRSLLLLLLVVLSTACTSLNSVSYTNIPADRSHPVEEEADSWSVFGIYFSNDFVDEVHEVTDRFRPGADPAATMAELAASARQASLWGRTNYGRAFTRFAEEHPGVLTPRTNLLVLGDARSNHGDLALPVLAQLVHEARHSWWLNPEHRRSWDTGDSAAREYGRLVPMVECRNLTQLEEFVHDLA